MERSPPVLFAPAPATDALITAVADVDGDGIADVLVFDIKGCNAYVTLGGAAPRTLAAQHLTSCPSQCIMCQVDTIADFNGDSRADVVIGTDSGFIVIFGGSGGALSMGSATNAVVRSDTYLAGDIDGDGHLDLGTSGGGNPGFLRGHGDGTFDSPGSLPGSPYKETLMLLTDIDGDGRVDVVTETDGLVVAIRLGTGGGAFGSPSYYDAAKGVERMAAIPIRSNGPKSLLLDVLSDPLNGASGKALRLFSSRCY